MARWDGRERERSEERQKGREGRERYRGRDALLRQMKKFCKKNDVKNEKEELDYRERVKENNFLK